MIEAVLRGKLGSDYSRAHDRCEELLTSTVFGLLRYLPIESGILPILASARLVRCDERSPARVDVSEERLSFTGVKVEFEFWPSLGEHGQPDLLLRLLDEAGNTQSAVLVEVKLDAPKSGEADSDEEASDDAPDPDQLVKYWRGLNKRFPACIAKTLIYLTSHTPPPFEELAKSLHRDRDMRLAWLSWRDVWRILEPCISAPAEDIKRLLAHHGFRPFRGIEGTPVTFPLNGFWNAAGWFFVPPIHCPPSGFWRSSR